MTQLNPHTDHPSKAHKTANIAVASPPTFLAESMEEPLNGWCRSSGKDPIWSNEYCTNIHVHVQYYCTCTCTCTYVARVSCSGGQKTNYCGSLWLDMIIQGRRKENWTGEAIMTSSWWAPPTYTIMRVRVRMHEQQCKKLLWRPRRRA